MERNYTVLFSSLAISVIIFSIATPISAKYPEKPITLAVFGTEAGGKPDKNLHHGKFYMADGITRNIKHLSYPVGRGERVAFGQGRELAPPVIP